MRRFRPSFVALAAVVLLAGPAAAAGPKPIGTITVVGNAALTGVPIVAYQWAATVTPEAGGGGLGSGKVGFEPFTVTKLVDGASPVFLQRTFQGSTLQEVRVDVTLRRGTTATYLLTEAHIVRDDRHPPDGGGPQLQTIAFAPTSVRETVVSGGGTVTVCWTLDTGAACE
jgi:type VI protein secretion system component Hcp